MILFTKNDCDRCHYLTENFDLLSLGIKEECLGMENPKALALLAWHEIVEVAQENLPILLFDDFKYSNDFQEIKEYVEASAKSQKMVVSDESVTCSKTDCSF